MTPLPSPFCFAVPLIRRLADPQLKTVVDRVRKEQGWGFFDYADENKDGVVSEAELEKVLLEVDRSLKAFPATAQARASCCLCVVERESGGGVLRWAAMLASR